MPRQNFESERGRVSPREAGMPQKTPATTRTGTRGVIPSQATKRASRTTFTASDIGHLFSNISRIRKSNFVLSRTLVTCGFLSSCTVVFSYFCRWYRSRYIKQEQKRTSRKTRIIKMTSIFRAATRNWNYLVYELGDDRTKDWFLTGSPIPCIILMIVYYRFVKKVGPEFMKHREPFNLDKIIQVYNLIQVFLSGWIAYEGYRVTYGSLGNYDWTCQPMDSSMSPLAFRVASVCWMYYMTKLFDLLDTVFFVLRKKFNQVSFLHVYHHMGVIALGYIATKYFPDGHGFILVPLNSFVHTFMYGYYFITNYNPEYRKKIWWKKYITQLQILQFMFLLVHYGKVFFLSKCDYPKLPLCLFLPQNVLITVLFVNFYIKTYLKPNKPLKSS